MSTQERLTDLIDRELRMRGSSLAAWAAERALTPVQLASLVGSGDAEVVFELCEAIGLRSPRAAAR